MEVALPKELNNMLGIRSPDTEPLSTEELKKMLDTIPQPKLGLRALIMIGLNSGITLKEALAIKVEDIKYAEGAIVIYDFEKNAYRKLLLPPSVMQDVRTYMDGYRKGDNARLFDISESTAKKGLTDLTKEAILKPKNWSSIRHTWAKLAFEHNIPIKIMSESSGVPEQALLKWDMHGNVKQNGNFTNGSIDLLDGVK